MGLKQIIVIEDLLKSGKKSFGELRKLTGMNFHTLTDSLAYLVNSGKIKFEGDGYEWLASTSGKGRRGLKQRKCLQGSRGISKSKTRKAKRIR